MSSLSQRPRSELGAKLLAAARDEAPPSASLERALAVAESTATDAASADDVEDPASRVASRRWPFAVLAAAALLTSLIAVLWGRPRESAPLAQPWTIPPVAPPAATNDVAMPEPSVTADPSPPPSRIAVRDTPKPRPASGAAPPPARPSAGAKPAACGCAPDDLMCHVRCSDKKK
jgi:hypothetical protein